MGCRLAEGGAPTRSRIRARAGGRAGEAKPERIALFPGPPPVVAPRRASRGGVGVERPTARHPIVAGDRAGRVDGRAVGPRVVAVPVEHPLPDIPMHVIEPTARGLLLHSMRFVTRVAAVPPHPLQIGLFIPRAIPCPRQRRSPTPPPRPILPLDFGRQPCADPCRVCHRLVPAHAARRQRVGIIQPMCRHQPPELSRGHLRFTQRKG